MLSEQPTLIFASLQKELEVTRMTLRITQQNLATTERFLRLATDERDRLSKIVQESHRVDGKQAMHT